MNDNGTKPVVVGIDGSTGSQAALAHGAWEAHRRGVPLRLVQSYQIAAPYGVVGFAPDPTELQRATDAARAVLSAAEIKVHLAYPHLVVTSALVEGSPGGALVDASADACLVVVGSRGLGGFAGLMLGSAGAQLAAHARAPVIVMRPPGDPGELGVAPARRPVLVGIDGVAGGEAAIAFAFDEAAARQVPLRAVYAWWILPASNLGPINRHHYDLEEAGNEAQRMLAESVAGWQDKYPDVDVELVAAHSLNPVMSLLEESADAGLLVVSRHGGNALTRLIFVSIGDAAVREARCPVAVVATQAAQTNE